MLVSCSTIPGREYCMLQLPERVHFLKNLCLFMKLFIEMYHFIYLS